VGKGVSKSQGKMVRKDSRSREELLQMQATISPRKGSQLKNSKLQDKIGMIYIHSSPFINFDIYRIGAISLEIN
jgi:hypothetical protein